MSKARHDDKQRTETKEWINFAPMQPKNLRIITSLNTIRRNRPRLPRHLFWDFAYDKIDWRRNYRTIISRVIERGTDQQWQEMIRFYGRDLVIHVLKYWDTSLTRYITPKVCEYFGLQESELARNTLRPAWRGETWQ